MLGGGRRSGSELRARGVAAEHALMSFAPSFVPAALGFLWGEDDCGQPEQPFQVLELVVDRAVGETRTLLGGGGDSECQQVLEAQQKGGVDGEGGLGDVLVAAFQLAASLLTASRQSEELVLGHRTQQRLCRQCEELIDALWAIGADDAEPMDQRLLWRELLCRRWDEAAASLALEMLLLGACTSGDSMRADEIAQAVAFAYAQLPTTLKELCMDQVAALVQTAVDEGPSFELTPRMALQLQLLDHLTAVHFLDTSDDLDVAVWIGEYFADCFECCGVALQLLSERPDDENEERSGLIRMLDMYLLVLKAGVDYFATRRHDIITLQGILSPTIVTALSQLAARMAIPTEARSIETSLYLLARMGGVLEEDECDALSKVFAKLLDPNTASSFSAARPTLRSTCFDAAHALLAHSNVTEMMGPPLTALLQAEGIKDLHAEYVRMIQTRSLKESEAVEIVHHFPDEVGLLSVMDLDDARCREKFDEHCVKHEVDAGDGDAVRVAAASFEVPQWFPDEDSADDSEVDVTLPLPPLVDEGESKDSQDNISSASMESAVPQWFDDVEEEPDVKSPLWTLEEDSSEDPEERALLSLERRWEHRH